MYIFVVKHVKVADMAICFQQANYTFIMFNMFQTKRCSWY